MPISVARRLLALCGALVLGACVSEPPPPPTEPPFLRTYAPENAEPGINRYPVVILVPGCLSPAEGSGAPQYERFGKRLAEEGYFVGLISWRGAWPGHAGCAAYADANAIAAEIDRAASALRQSALAQKDRIHLVGWSRAALGVIAAIGTGHGADPAYRASTIIYPDCPTETAWTSNTSLQFLLSAQEEEAAERCRKFADDADGPAPIAILEYDVPRGFDIRPSADPAYAWIFNGRDNSTYDPAMTEAAYTEILKFLRIGDPRPAAAANAAGGSILTPPVPPLPTPH